jgi:hypothetical protein
MKNQTFVKAIGILILTGAASCLSAAGPAIGMAVADGRFYLDQASVTGNGTLFDGSHIQTLGAPSQLRWSRGAQFRMGAASRASVYEHRLVLESGTGQLDASPGFEVEAGTLHVSAEQSEAIARIGLSSPGHLTVAAFRGAVRVTNSAGLLVAKVEAGASLDFEPQAAGAEAPTQAAGCLLEHAGKFIMAEQTTSIVLEVRGAGLDRELGNRVRITGRAIKSAAGSAQVIEVLDVKPIAKGGCTAIAKKLGAATGVAAPGAVAAANGTGSAAGAAGGAKAAGAATAAHAGKGAVAVIGGVAAAATVGGLAAVGSLPGQSDTPPSASR